MLDRIRLVLRHPRARLIIYAEVALLLLLALAALPGGFDYLGYFYRLAKGCENCTYNPYFTEWFMLPFGLLGWRESYLAFMAVSMAILYWATQQLGGRPLLALLSGTFIWVLWLGQIDALPALGLGIAWWSLKTDRRLLVGLGLLLLATKPQLGGFAIVALAVWAGPRALIIPAIAALASFILYGLDWPTRWLSYTPQTMFAGDAWFYISPIWLLIGLAGVFINRGRKHQLQYIVTATAAGAPFLGAYSLFVILLFPLKWWEIAVGYIPFAVIALTDDRWWLGLLLAQPLLIMGRLLYANRNLQSTLSERLEQEAKPLQKA